MSEPTIKQQVLEKIKHSSNILVTVSNSPSVDELSAALGTTLLLNKLDKHATAVFSGDVPLAISFLEPDKTFEHTVDSLRDFIIALDKEKADHLRYKVEGDVVKIYITPYRTTLTRDDLDFSQGDYNVELVLAIGVRDTNDLDKALEAHGRILHDATVVSISIGDDKADLGDINWRDSNARSYSELLSGLADDLKTESKLLDQQIATAFLTGIVAASNRFSNQNTTARAMTVAAQLMAAGANPQLIASKLEKSLEAQPNTTTGDIPLPEQPMADVPREEDDGVLAVDHDEGVNTNVAANQKLSKRLATSEQMAAAIHKPLLDQVQDDVAKANSDISNALAEDAPSPTEHAEPQFGGTLNATTAQAAEAKEHEIALDRNRTILSHDLPAPEVNPPSAPQISSYQSPFSAGTRPPSYDEIPVDALTYQETPIASVPSVTEPLFPAPIAQPTLAEIEREHRSEYGNQQATEQQEDAAVVSSSPGEEVLPAISPTPVDMSMPPMPDFSTLPPLPPIGDPTIPSATVESKQKIGDILPPLPSTPVESAGEASLSVPSSSDPGQFRIPGQS